MSIKDRFATGNPVNILIIITDQERTVSEWRAKDRTRLAGMLPAMGRLKANGLSFDHAYTAACMCSPSRATFQTSQYPIVTGCTTTGESTLPTNRPTIANVLSNGTTSYTTYWIGKWHLFPKAEEPGSGSEDLSTWGYQPYESYAWDPPDAGWTLGDNYLGGGTQGPAENNRNDERYVHDARHFLKSAPSEPWCLIVSLVNPHDVHLGYMSGEDEKGNEKSLDRIYYDEEDIAAMDIALPEDNDQLPSTMPRGQAYCTWNSQTLQPGTAMPKPPTKKNYANFYAYLTTHVDHQVGQVLDAVQDLDNTLIIRFADHGEMGLAHGLVEKFVNAYSQCTHVPLVFSNPNLWKTGQTTQALASTVDLLPTLASLVGASYPAGTFVGTDLTPVLDNPQTSVQEYVHYTYDDEYNYADPNGPSVIRAIRSQQWMYAVYVDSVTSATTGYSDADWEMYDLTKDPEERVNLAGTGLVQQAVLDWCLQVEMITKGTTPSWYGKWPAVQHWPPQKTAASVGGPPPTWNPPAACAISQLPGVTAAQVDALSRDGVGDSGALLARWASPGGRQALARVAGVDERQVDAWITSARTPLEMSQPT